MDYMFTQNRELSWLKFNERCLDEASNKNIPVLERLNFFQIFNSNLDEFFMIRVGSLKDLYLLNEVVIDTKTGLNPYEQLNKIYECVSKLYAKREETYKNLVKDLEEVGIIFAQSKNLSTEENKKIKKRIQEHFDTIANVIESKESKQENLFE